MLTNPRHETFCRAYAVHFNGTEAARAADYDYDHAANQAYRLLKRPDIQARLAEFQADDERLYAEREAERAERRARLAALRATEAEALLARLDPLYEERLEAGDHATVLKIVALQAQIAGLLGEDDDAPRRRPARNRRGPRNASSGDGPGLV